MKTCIKKIVPLLIAFLLTLTAVSCKTAEPVTPAATDAPAATEAPAAPAVTEDPAATEAPAEPVTLIVFAAASMTETLTQIADLYKTVAPDVELVFTFDSSGTLKTQIEEGADCDLFISAAQKQMNALDKNDTTGTNTAGLDFVLDGTRVNLLENKVVLVVPEGNPAGILSFADMSGGLTDGSMLLAMGNADVPVGQYTQKILAYYELDEATLAESGVLTYGSNVKEVTTQVSEGAVSCGIVYATDAASAGLDVVDNATESMCGQVIYPAAVMKNALQAEAAQAFLDYLKTDADAMAVFASVGFSPVA